jgi:hypothetical protein
MVERSLSLPYPRVFELSSMEKKKLKDKWKERELKRLLFGFHKKTPLT